METPSRHDEHDTNQPVIPVGRDEMNLAEFPIALVADRVPKGQKTLHFEDQHGRLTVTGSDAYGLPTAADADVIVALIYLTKLRNDFKDAKVNFSRYELVKMLGWRDEGDSYRRLDLSFNRWGGVWLVYNKCWWNNRLKCYTDAKMHIIESVEIVDGDARRRAHPDGRNGLPLSHFTWNRKFIESCQANNLRELDLDEYFSLGSAVAKRLYRFLDKRFYLQGDWTFDLREIAFDRVGLSRGYEHNAAKIREKLQPAIEELEAIGFLQPLGRDDRYARVDRGQWTIRLIRQGPAPALDAPEPPPPPAVEPEPPRLVAALTDRGVTKATASDLVQRHPAERIEGKIAVFDWLTEGGDKRIEKSPAGYLVRSIADDYAVPQGFVPAAERRRQAEIEQAEQRAAADARRRRQAEEAEEARERRLRQDADAYWRSLGEDDRAALQAEADAQADPGTLELEAGPFKRMGRKIRRDQHIRRLLAGRGPAPADG